MRLVWGVGVNDADYVVVVRETTSFVAGKQKQRVVWRCPFYKVWSHMLGRCYSNKHHEQRPSYINCSVCEEWLRFSTFKAWMQDQEWEGNELDKDLLLPGNKVYSPETCVFVSRQVNSFVIEVKSSRGAWPIGVSWYTVGEKFRAQCSNPFVNKNEHLGYFTTPEEAHQAWLTRKLELAKMLAAEQSDPRVAEALIKRYENYTI